MIGGLRFLVVAGVVFACTRAATKLLNLPEGSVCEVDGVNGTCVLWYRCLTLVADQFDKKAYPPVCTFRGEEPVLCCTSCELTDDIRYALIDTRQGGFIYKTDQKSWNKCVDYYVQIGYFYDCLKGIHGGVDKALSDSNCHTFSIWSMAAAGGENAARGEFPHMALLGYGVSEAEAQYLCGGTVISERFILTAAHCVADPRLGVIKYVALGILRRSDPPQLWQRYRVAAIVPHPEYEPPSKYHDIALLKTDKEIIFGINVMPACLPRLKRNVTELPRDVEETRAVAAGWGSTRHRGQPADTLQRVQLSRFNESQCSRQYRRERRLARGYDARTQMCYGDQREAKDTCEGDSGGPLQVPGPLADCQPVVVGVTSFGKQCGVVGSAGVYTRVAHYVPWIESVVWP